MFIINKISSDNGAAITTNKNPKSGELKIIEFTPSWFELVLFNSNTSNNVE